jgi:hypothetical protein
MNHPGRLPPNHDNEDASMQTPLPGYDPVRTARELIERYGLRAAAVAQQRAAEAQASGESAEIDHWQSVAFAIADLRHSRATRH